MKGDSGGSPIRLAAMTKQSAVSGLGARIRKRRLEVRLTQTELGEPELHSSYISLIESGQRQPSPEALGFIADRLGTTVEELLSGRPPGLEVELELQIHGARRDTDQGRVQEAEKSLLAVIKQARRHGLTRVEARAVEVLGAIAERTAGPEAALSHFEAAEELWRSEPIHLRFDTVAGLARCRQQLETPQLAIHLLDTYRRDLEGSGMAEPTALMRVHTALIYPYFAAGLPEKAAEAAREAVRLETRVEDPEQLACMHLAVARSLLYEGHHEDALASLRKAEEIYLAGGWRNRVAKAQINEAIVLSKQEDFGPAQQKLLSALDILNGSPNQLDEALALNELGHVTRRLDDISSALGYLERARKLLEEGDIIEQAFNEREIGICLVPKDSKLAEIHLKSAVDLYRISGATAELATTFKALGDLYAARGDTDLALDALREGLAAVEERSA
jgi:tetratricopeptide (TPR) repeat protein